MRALAEYRAKEQEHKVRKKGWVGSVGGVGDRCLGVYVCMMCI